MATEWTISLGVGARKLRDRDIFSKSDPYLIISKPCVSGGFQKLRTSETKVNSLNPDWADFLFRDRELSYQDQDLRLRFEIYDNDYGHGKDQSLGMAFYSLKQLEAAATLKTPLALGDGKGKSNAGHLVIRHFSRHKPQGPDRGCSGYTQHSGGDYTLASHKPGNTIINSCPGGVLQPPVFPSAAGLPYPTQPSMGQGGVFWPQTSPQQYPPQVQGNIYPNLREGLYNSQGPLLYPSGVIMGANQLSYPTAPGTLEPQNPQYPQPEINNPTNNMSVGSGGFIRPPY